MTAASEPPDGPTAPAQVPDTAAASPTNDAAAVAESADPSTKKPQSAFERARSRLRPTLAAIVVLGLVLVQANAMRKQANHGYRPFRHEPGHVAFSWDMFAQRLTRCDIEWNPPLKPKSPSDERFARMRSLAPYFEWNPVLHDADDYLSFGRRACAKYGDGPDRSFTLTCFYPGFRETQHVIPCR